MNIAINQHPRICPLAIGPLRRLLHLLMERACGAQATEAWREVSLLLTDDTGIARVHAMHLGDDAVTDVISYRFAPLPGETGGLTGELIVNIEQALRLGSRRGPEGAARELALYLAHGCDHLGGGDDATEAGRRAMRRRELRWLQTEAIAAAWRQVLRPPSGRVSAETDNQRGAQPRHRQV